MEYVSKSQQETEEIAVKILKNHPEYNIFALKGDLGSGKTVFVRGICRFLGVKNHIASPTFVIMKIYPIGKKHIFHIDAYRLSSYEDLKSIGFEEIASKKNNLLFIEWPEKVFSKIPQNVKLIKFKYIDENQRQICG